MSFFDDVGEFHRKFELPVTGDDVAMPLLAEIATYRVKFILEEVAEIAAAAGATGVAAAIAAVADDVSAASFTSVPNMSELLDGLVDTAWVCMGTAHYAGLPFNEAWAEVKRANLDKTRAPTDPKRPYRTHAIVKPAGWRPPSIEAVIARHNLRVIEEIDANETAARGDVA